MALGYVYNLTEEQLNEEINNTEVPHSEGKTWGEWLNAAPVEKDGITYYPMHTNYNNGSRDTNPNQDEFWAVFDKFGADNVKLAYEVL